jgi:hypothetical protein
MMTSNAVPPSVTPPSPNEWPQDLVKPVTGITNDSQAKVTSIAHGFTSLDQGVTFICFKQVQGMLQINGLDCLIQKVIDADHFTVNINSTNFHTYMSGGVIIVDSGLPPIEQQGFQVFNTPFQNIATTL